VAKINQVKLRQDADAAERAGRFDKAIDSLKQIVQENPRDWNTVNRIGDLFGKLNNPKAANEQYVKVARYFADDGFYLKAIAVWKKVLRNEPSLLDGHVSLGDLYQKQGLVAEARQTFAFVYDEYVKRNKLREAGEVLRRMAEVDPADMKVRIRLAELYGREGNPDKAATEFVGIAEELVKKGLLAEALQLLEKALRSGQRSARLLTAAARVHLVQKDFAGAVSLLDEAQRAAPGDRDIALRLAEACVGARRGDQARAVLQALLDRDPGDQDARQQLIQVFLSEGRYDEAFDQALPIVDRLVERRQIDRGAALLQQIVQRNPTHVRSLAKLVELYRVSRNDLLVAQTYSLMVEAYLAEGRQDQAAAILEVLVQLEPTNEQHRTKLKWLRDQQESSGGFDLDLAHPAPLPPVVAAAQPPAPAQHGIELSGPLSSEDQEFIGEHLAEGRVFRKYGLGDKARDQFDAVLSRYPDNTDALQELSDLLREKGEYAAATQRLRVLAEVFRLKGDAARAARVDEEAAALGGPPIPAPDSAPPAAKPPSAPAPAVPALSGIVPAAFEPPAPVAPSLAEAPAAAAKGQASADVGLEVDIDVEDTESPVEELAFDLESPPDDADAHPQRFDESELGPPGGEIGGQFIDEDGPAAPADSGFDLSDAAAGVPPAEGSTAPFFEVPAVAAAALPVRLVVPSAALAAPLRDVPIDLRRALDEIESFVALGFVEDAKGVLADVASRFADHPALVQRLSELGLELPQAGPAQPAGDEFVLVETPPVPDALGSALAAAPGPAAIDEPLQLSADFLDLTAQAPAAAEPAQLQPPAAPEPGGFDLSAELGDLFGAQPAVWDEESATQGTDLGDSSLADIFREFQKGVEKQLGKEDYETRYNLGIAYKEMGLVDEAIAEFQLAAKDDSRLLECASMLGICFLEKGMPKLAVKWFEKGLQAPGRSEDEYQALRYDLATAFEQAGDTARALELFTELYGQDAQFRDVAEKVRRLGR
jgi:tetratricopeptide (TPR) repeat protein